MALPHNYAEAVARAVRAAIEEAGQTPNSVAKGSLVPQPTLHRRLHSDGRSPFTLPELDAIAQFLAVPVEQFTAPERVA